MPIYVPVMKKEEKKSPEPSMIPFNFDTTLGNVTNSWINSYQLGHPSAVSAHSWTPKYHIGQMVYNAELGRRVILTEIDYNLHMYRIKNGDWYDEWEFQD